VLAGFRSREPIKIGFGNTFSGGMGGCTAGYEGGSAPKAGLPGSGFVYSST
jgi:hypothetical protein